MPHKLIALAEDGTVVGASYYETNRGFLSALAVLPEWRGKRIGKLLIAASVRHMHCEGLKSSSLHVLGCDAGKERHSLYTSCGFEGGDARHGGTYVLKCIPENYEELIMEAPGHG